MIKSGDIVSIQVFGAWVKFDVTPDSIDVISTLISDPSISWKLFNCKCLNVKEVGTLDCGYCCKIVQCEKCGKQYDSHRRTYGCPQGYVAK